MIEGEKDVISPVTIFYSYAHEDEKLLNRLQSHLSLMHRQGIITDWYNRQIVAGTDWAYTINNHLMTASIILLLISPDFLASDYCWSIEMEKAMEQHYANKARVIPVLLRPVDWHESPFGHLQALPTDLRPVTLWRNQDDAFLDITKGIREAIKNLQTPSSTIPRPILQHTTLLATNRQMTPEYHASSVDLRYRRNMLEKVQSIWIDGLLEHSLHGSALIVLGLQEQSDVVLNPLISPWRLVVQEIDQPSRALSPDTHILQVYENAGGELLILGEPGAGKTTLLLELARDLLSRAKHDETLPIPVIFNLSSWAVKRQTLVSWLIEELNNKYQVPKKLAKVWVDNDIILPLLDGLDEVAPALRAVCLGAINAYRQEHGMIPTVVCSRSAEYLAQKRSIRLRSAVIVQPLTTQQIDQYLASGGEMLAALRLAFRNDVMLQEMAATPLMLSVLTLTYYGMPTEDLLKEDNPSERQRQVFTTYVHRMLERRSATTRYTSQQTIRWLTWLAGQLLKHDLTVFSIEEIHPGWLPNDQSRRRHFNTVVTLPAGFFCALVIGLLIGMLVSPVAGLLVGVQGGLSGMVTIGLFYERHIAKQPAEVPDWSWKEMFPRLKEFMRKGQFAGALVGPILGMVAGLAMASILGPHIGPAIELYRPGGLVSISIISLISGLLIGLICGLLIGLIVGMISGLFIGLMIGLWSINATRFQYGVLKLLLWRAGLMNWNYLRFLDYATDRILLRKVGNGYIFIHRLLLDYFASLENAPTSDGLTEHIQETLPTS